MLAGTAEAPSEQALPPSRPYRSHKIRACDRCRQRKARCEVALLGEDCQLCRDQGKACRYSDPKSSRRPVSLAVLGESSPPERSSLKRSYASIENSEVPRSPSFGSEAWQASQPLQNVHRHNCASAEDASGAHSQSLHIVGPAISSDAHVLEQYMSPGTPERRGNDNPYSVYCSDPSKPVLYRKVPKGRVGLSINKNPGAKELEILEQVLYPHTHQLQELYLAKIHPAFPVIDEKLLDIAVSNQNEASAALICDVYATSLLYWNQAPFSANRSRPDQRYAWNLAVQALQDDFLAPGLVTLQAALVDLNGRPVSSIIGNVVNNGRAVALSYSLGVNRNPTQWNISLHEKNLRIRLWWGVLIHDRWGSFAHGTPSNISAKHYDVPIPSLEVLLPQGSTSPDHQKSSECFIGLCRLTEILGQTLPLVYDLEGKSPKDVSKIIRRVVCDLDEWEDTLPEYLVRTSDCCVNISGWSSLQLCFLSLKMLICRISLHAVTQRESSEAIEAYQFRQVESRQAAQAVVDFITSLKSSQLAEFWLPYTAYYLTSTITLLLRFAVETTDDTIAEACVSSVKTFTSWLRRARDAADWDLADDCLNNCEGIIARMTDNGCPPPAIIPEALPTNFFDTDPPNWLDATLPVSYGPMDGSGQFRDLWDMFGFDGQFPV